MTSQFSATYSPASVEWDSVDTTKADLAACIIDTSKPTLQ